MRRWRLCFLALITATQLKLGYLECRKASLLCYSSDSDETSSVNMQKSGDEKPEKTKEGVTPDGGSSPASSTSKSEQNDMNIRCEDVAKQVLQKLSKLSIRAEEDSGQSESECSSEEESSSETDSDSEQDSPILTRSKWPKKNTQRTRQIENTLFFRKVISVLGVKIQDRF